MQFCPLSSSHVGTAHFLFPGQTLLSPTSETILARAITRTDKSELSEASRRISRRRFAAVTRELTRVLLDEEAPAPPRTDFIEPRRFARATIEHFGATRVEA